MGKTMRIAAITLFIARVVRRWCDRTTIVLRAAGAVVQGVLRVTVVIVLQVGVESVPLRLPM